MGKHSAITISRERRREGTGVSQVEDVVHYVTVLVNVLIMKMNSAVPR